MVEASLRMLAVAAAAFALVPAPAAAVTPVNACRDLDKAGETYLLINDVSSNNICFRVLADRITLDLGGHTITGPGSVDTAVGIWDFNGARTSTVVKNGTIKAFEFGINLRFSSRSTIRNVTVSDHAIGMEVGPNSLVKDCIVQRNVFDGIRIGDHGQVESCVVGKAEPGAAVDGNGSGGILGGNRLLATRNTVIGNGFNGILALADSTVTYNTVTNNLDGINLGPRSLVTYNTANDNRRDGIFVRDRITVNYNTAADNGSDGIQAVCPSTIMYNTLGPNGGENIHTIGAGCVVKNNK